MSERFKLIPEVFLFIEKDGQILLSRRFQTGWEDGNYGFVAGHGEEHETMREGAVREGLEEAGIEIDPADLEFKLAMHRYSSAGEKVAHERIGFYFKVSKWKGEIKNMEPNRCDDLRFFPLDNLPENTIPHIREAIDCYKKGIMYAEHDFEKRL